MEELKRSLKEAPIVQLDGYDYFIHPVTDGIPLVKPSMLREIVDGITAMTDFDRVDKIVAPEAMGIHHATALSIATNTPFVVIRKRSYGFGDEVGVRQEIGYSEDELYINNVKKGDRVLAIDDVYSTGGTLTAICSAIEETGADLIDVIVVLKRKSSTEPDDALDVKSLLEITVRDGEIIMIE